MSGASKFFELLAVTHRRRILFLLCERETVDLPGGLLASAGEGAGNQASTNTAQTGTAAGDTIAVSTTAQDPNRLGLELVHKHLPKLEACGLVDWDSDAGRVSRGPEFEEVEPALRTLAENADTFPGNLL